MVKVTAKVERVIDGDTFHGTMRIYYPYMDKDERYFNRRFRLLGVNTPERGQEGYEEAKEFTKQMIEGKEAQIEIHGTDSFGRFLCKVFVDEGCLNDMLLEKGLAVPYQRKRRSA